MVTKLKPVHKVAPAKPLPPMIDTIREKLAEREAHRADLVRVLVADIAENDAEIDEAISLADDLGLSADDLARHCETYQRHRRAHELRDAITRAEEIADAMRPQISEISARVNTTGRTVDNLRNASGDSPTLEQLRVLREAEHAWRLSSDELAHHSQQHKAARESVSRMQQELSDLRAKPDEGSRLEAPRNFPLS